MKVRLVFTLLLGLTCACESVHEEVADIDVARHHLNQGRYHSARVILQRLLQKHPYDVHIKMMLASAYSGGVGINIINCFDVLKDKLFDQPLTKKFGAKPKKKSKTNDAVKVFERELIKSLKVAGDAVEMAFKLPYVTPQQRKQVGKALALLKTIEFTPEYRTAQLYIAILNMVQFLSYLRDSLPHARLTAHPVWYWDLICNLDLQEFLNQMRRGLHHLSAGFEGMRNAKFRSNTDFYKNLQVVHQSLERTLEVYYKHKASIDLSATIMSFTRALQCP